MIKSVLIIYQYNKDNSLLRNLEDILKQKKINFELIEREALSKNNYLKKELIVVIGGDGTFLRASHLNKSIPMVGINPNPEKKEGFFMQLTSHNYKSKIETILQGRFSLIDLLRLNVEINNNLIEEPILNEIYVGDIKPYNVFNYEIKTRQEKEFQRSSGIIIGTPAGSNAWLRSAGGDTLGLTEKKYQFMARELYERKLTKNYKLKTGILNIDEEIEIISKSPGILVIDSLLPEYPLKIGDCVKIYASKEFLPYIKLD